MASDPRQDPMVQLKLMIGELMVTIATLEAQKAQLMAKGPEPVKDEEAHG